MSVSQKIDTKLAVALIGLGRIGSLNDSGKINTIPRSHAGALFASPHFKLIAAFDSNLNAKQDFAQHWQNNTPVHLKLTEIKNYPSFDLVVISASTKNQKLILKEILRAKPRLILCEKPFCSSLSEARSISKILEKNNIPTFINFHRRVEPRFIDLKNYLTQMGTPIKVHVIYKKGLVNYGSHIIDLLIYFFGGLKSVKAKKIHAFQKCMDDPSISGTLIFKCNLEVDLIGIDQAQYEQFEMEIFYPDKKITIELGGFSIYQRIATVGEHYENYNSLSEPQLLYKSGPVAGLKEVYENIYSILNGKYNKKYQLTNAKETLDIWNIIHALKKSSLTGRSIHL